MQIIVLAFALWFFYEFLKNLLPWLATPPPSRTVTPFVLALFCLIAGLILLYEGGFISRMHA